jgi:hypothetical protein
MIKIATFSFVVALSTIASAQSLKNLERELSSLNPSMRLFNPPRSDWGPGFVFSGQVKKGKMSGVRPVCLFLFDGNPNTILTESEVALSNISSIKSRGFDASVGALSKALGPENAAKLELKNARKSNLKVEWGDVIHRYIADESLFSNGRRVPVRQECRAAIEQSATVRPKDSLFIVWSVLQPSALDFSFSADKDGALRLVAPSIGTDVNAGAGITWNRNDERTLRLKGGLNVGYAVAALSEYVLAPTMGGNLADIKLEKKNLVLPR